MDFIRALLIAAESGDKGPLANYGEKEKAYHIALLMEAGLVHGALAGGNLDPEVGHIHRLTWAGHDWLQSVRDDTLWKKAKEHVIKSGASWTFDLLKEWAKNEIRIRLQLPLP